MKKEEISKAVQAGVEMTRAIGDCIRELGQVPAGHLYTRLMSQLSLEQFELFVGILVQAKLVRRERSNLLVWIGPVKKEAV